MAWVFAEAPQDLKPAEMLVLLILADGTNDDPGRICPVVDRISHDSRMSVKRVRRALRGLVDKGVISIEIDDGTSVCVQFCAFTEEPRKPGDPRKSAQYAAWRSEVLHRDGYTCRHCLSTENLHAHHIKSWKEHPELRFDVVNGLTLCATCHRQAHGKAI